MKSIKSLRIDQRVRQFWYAKSKRPTSDKVFVVINKQQTYHGSF